MANIYLNSAGSATAPYSTSETGFPTLKAAIDSGVLNDGDTLVLSSDISTGFVGAATVVNKLVNMVSNNSTQRKITLDGGFTIRYNSSTGSNMNILIENIHFDGLGINMPPPGQSKDWTYRGCRITFASANPFDPLSGTRVFFENTIIENVTETVGLPPGMLLVLPSITTTLSFVNCVFINNISDVLAGGLIGYVGATSAANNFIFVNNIMQNINVAAATGTVLIGANSCTTVVKYNSCFNYAVDPFVNVSVDATNVVTDPKLEDINTGVYTLASDSPFINKGYYGYQMGLGMIVLINRIVAGAAHSTPSERFKRRLKRGGSFTVRGR